MTNNNFIFLEKIKEYKFIKNLEDEWLIFSDDDWWLWYDFTPLNVKTFASTWWDWVHFSFLEIDGKYSDNNPVVMTVPMNYFEDSNIIVWENLYDFLSLGINYSYFWLEQLTYNFDITIKEIESWKYCDFENSWNSKILENFAKDFKIKKWTEWSIHTKLNDLKEKYYSLLKFNTGI